MNEKRVKLTTWISKEQRKRIEDYLEIAPESTMTAFVSSAIDFYGQFLMSEENSYLPLAISSSMNGIIKGSEEKIGKILFKNAVEMSMMMNILSATVEIDEKTLQKLRVKCINDLKSTNGKINFEDINQYQKKD